MSNNDSFIDEVTEAVRRDQLFAMMRKYGWVAILAVIVIVGGTSYVEYRKAQEQAAAQAEGDRILAALAETTPEAQAKALAAIDPGDNAGRKALLGMLAADSEVAAGKTAEARAALDGVASDPATPEIFRDLARLKSILIGASDGSLAPDARIKELDPLTQAGNPYRLIALEQVALAQAETGDTKTAIDTLKQIISDAGVTQGLRRRAQQLIVALGGSLTAG